MEVVVANIVSTFGHLWDFFVGFKFNEKGKILLLSLVSSGASLFSMILLGSWSGVVSVSVTMARLISIYWKDKHDYKATWLLFLFLLLYAMVFFDENIWVAVLMFLGNMCSFLPKWFCKNVQYIRIGALGANLLCIVYSILILNFASIPFNIFNVVTICISIVKWHIQLNKSNSEV
jgi:hypothetical protein